MLSIFLMKTKEHEKMVEELFWEYLVWANSMVKQEFGIRFDIKLILEKDILELDKFNPPNGRILLASYENQIAGIACLRKIRENIGEFKRMYVRSAFRGKGIGRALLDKLINEARQIGYPRVWLDSARFMKTAHILYRSSGFQEIDPYSESEISKEFQPNWIFMELILD